MACLVHREHIFHEQRPKKKHIHTLPHLPTFVHSSQPKSIVKLLENIHMQSHSLRFSFSFLFFSLSLRWDFFSICLRAAKTSIFYIFASKFKRSYYAALTSFVAQFFSTQGKFRIGIRMRLWMRDHRKNEREKRNRQNKTKREKKCLKPHKIFRTQYTMAKLIGRSGGRLIIIHLFSHLNWEKKEERWRERKWAREWETEQQIGLKQKRNQIQTQINKVGHRFHCFLSLAQLSRAIHQTE